MLVKNILDYSTIEYKYASLVIGFPICKNFKCGRELCQNSPLASSSSIEISRDEIIDIYRANPLTKAFVMAGLEPIDSFSDLYELLWTLDEEFPKDDKVIYTGYNKEEIEKQLELLKRFKNIIVKFGRFIPNQDLHYDEVLGVKLVSDNQYAERIS